MAVLFYYFSIPNGNNCNSFLKNDITIALPNSIQVINKKIFM